MSFSYVPDGTTTELDLAAELAAWKRPDTGTALGFVTGDQLILGYPAGLNRVVGRSWMAAEDNRATPVLMPDQHLFTGHTGE